MDLTTIKPVIAANVYQMVDQAFKFNFTGLKPLTRHYFYCETLDVSRLCKQFGKNLGDPLVTDSFGKIQFTFFYSQGNEAALAYTVNVPASNTSVSNKSVILRDLSGVSNAQTTLTAAAQNPAAYYNRYT